MNTINERIKLLRTDNKLTQKQFSERILVTQSYLSRIESGKEMPNDKLIKLIALEFNVSTEWLEKGTGTKTIDKNSYDYFERNYSKEFHESLIAEINEFKESLQKQNAGIVSLNIQGIIMEMKNFLEYNDFQSNASLIIVFEKIASVIMTLFDELKELNSQTEINTFNSLAWRCTSELIKSLNEIEQLYFNPGNYRYKYFEESTGEIIGENE